MRGKPIIQWVLFIVAWGALAYPIARVARNGRQQPAPAESPGESVTTWVAVRFSAVPASFRILQDGKVLWTETQPRGDTFEKALDLAFDAFGVELQLVAELPEATTATELRLEPDGRDPAARTLWGQGPVDETVTFSWRRDD